MISMEIVDTRITFAILLSMATVFESTTSLKEQKMSTTTTTTSVPAGTYEIDPVHSSFGFAVGHNGVSRFRGHFDNVAATLVDGVLTGSATVDSVRTPIPPLKDHLTGPEFFDAAGTPTIDFRSSEIRVGEDGNAQIDGQLTIRGVTKPVKATGRVVEGIGLNGAEVVGVDLNATIDRREYGLNWQAPLPNGKNALDWDVTLEVQLELAKAAA
jgi:polyisoprenoid-binding protein YceI